jgi:D-sedoheptulose 7-phosphate isomerase
MTNYLPSYQWVASRQTITSSYSMSLYPEKIQAVFFALAVRAPPVKMGTMEPVLARAVADACRALQELAAQEDTFQKVAAAAVESLKSGGKLLTCGNGGSAADAMHLAEELVGRYRGNRRPLPAISLNADPTLLTCIGNDYGFADVFSRQVEGLGNQNDLLVCFSTSGNSENILRAMEAAKSKGVKSVALLGKDGGRARGKADFEIIVASQDSGRIQEAHTLILHALLEVIERAVAA